MSHTLDLPHYIVTAEQLASWLDSQGESWWSVDGDPILTSYVDFPCPTAELSAEIRRHGESLRVYDPRKDSTANGQSLPMDQLDDIADRSNRLNARTFLLSWEPNPTQWLLSEDLSITQDSE